MDIGFSTSVSSVAITLPVLAGLPSVPPSRSVDFLSGSDRSLEMEHRKFANGSTEVPVTGESSEYNDNGRLVQTNADWLKGPVGAGPDLAIDLTGSADLLSISHANWGSYNRKAFAIAFTIGSIETLDSNALTFFSKTDGVAAADIEFFVQITTNGATDGQLRFAVSNGSSLVDAITKGKIPRNPKIDTHIFLIFDSDNSTDADRMQIYVNGVRLTVANNGLESQDSISSGFTAQTNTDASVGWGAFNVSSPIQNWDGKIHQPTFLSPSDRADLPVIGDVYDTTNFVAKDTSGLSAKGLHSRLGANGSDVTEDSVLAAAWTNTGSVTIGSGGATELLLDRRIFAIAYTFSQLDLGQSTAHFAKGNASSEIVLSIVDAPLDAYKVNFLTDQNSDLERETSVALGFDTGDDSVFINLGDSITIYVEYDSTQAVEADRFKVYINGILFTGSFWETELFPELNEAVENSNDFSDAVWGASNSSGSNGFTGHIHLPAFFSRALPGIDAIWDSVNNVAKDYRNAAGVISCIVPTSGDEGADIHQGQDWTITGTTPAVSKFTPVSKDDMLNRQVFDMFAWIKRGTTGVNQVIFSKGLASAVAGEFFWQLRSDNKMRFQFQMNPIGTAVNRITTATFTNTSSFDLFHIKVDTTDAVAEDRVKLFHNGVRITVWDTAQTPSINEKIQTVPDQVVYWGIFNATVQRFEGLIFQGGFISGGIDPTTLYNSGVPIGLTDVDGFFAELSPDADADPTFDNGLAYDWINNNGVTTSNTIPA